MTQPVPEFPTNVESSNPYTGLDRGLFVLRGSGDYKYGRIHAARTFSQGPSASVGVLEYQVMQYKSLPKTAADYQSGTIAKAPDGTPWFDTLSRGSVLNPIVVEYWASGSFLTWYSASGEKLTPEEKALVATQAKTFTETMGSYAGLDEVELTATYLAIDGKPLERTSINLSIDYIRDNVKKHIDEENLPEGQFDPVRVALNLLKTA